MSKGNQFAKEALECYNGFTKTPHVIDFYRQQELPFGVFSNFFPAKIVVNQVEFLTSEHYFQAYKFATTDQQSFNDVVNCYTPGDAAAVGRDRGRPLRSDWESVKDDIMFDAITAKFLQHDSLFQILMKTDGSMLREKTARDSYWGTGPDDKGKNMLGILLMKLREELKKIPDILQQRVTLSVVIRESGVNPLRKIAVSPSTSSSSSSAPAASTGGGAVSTTTTDSALPTANDNNNSDSAVTASNAPKKSKNRLQ